MYIAYNYRLFIKDRITGRSINKCLIKSGQVVMPRRKKTVPLYKTVTTSLVTGRWKSYPLYSRRETEKCLQIIGQSNFHPMQNAGVHSRDTIMKHLDLHDFLTSYQHGFVRGRSSATQLFNVLDHWTKALDNDNSMDCVYISRLC